MIRRVGFTLKLLRKKLIQCYNKALCCNEQHISRDELAAPAVIFTPHPDDETLGCGGTIAMKKKQNAAVTIVVMTDGRSSHRKYMNPVDLSEKRKNELINAASELGIDHDDLYFLDYEDGHLALDSDQATKDVLEILKSKKPEQLYIPFKKEFPSDHRVTNSIVRAAMHKNEVRVVVFEYPVWHWMQWPWINNARLFRRKMLVLNSINNAFGLRMLRDFNCWINISDVLDVKRKALAQHESQNQRLLNNRNWQILSDVANGQFLDCFFSGFEIFSKYFFNGQAL